jgi:hypothetical protein
VRHLGLGLAKFRGHPDFLSTISMVLSDRYSWRPRQEHNNQAHRAVIDWLRSVGATEIRIEPDGHP